MRKNLVLASIILMIGLCPSVVLGKNKSLEPPPEGKAVVYFGRLTGFVGRARPFHFFEGEHYLIRLKGKNYLRYVCDPGEHLFWTAAENRSFVKVDLEAGKIYALNADMQFGTFSARAELQPITSQSKAWKEFRGMILGSDSEEIDPKYIERWTKNHPEYIGKALAEWKAAGEPALKLMKDETIE